MPLFIPVVPVLPEGQHRIMELVNVDAIQRVQQAPDGGSIIQWQTSLDSPLHVEESINQLADRYYSAEAEQAKRLVKAQGWNVQA